MKLNIIKISLSFLLVVLPSVLCTSISADDRTGGRTLDQHQITKRHDSKSDSSDIPNPDNTPPKKLKSQLWYKEQCIDHDADCSKTRNQWSQRYWMSKEFYQPGGPIFIKIGGESKVSDWVGGGAWNNYAKVYNATTLVVEHRFYGQSFPTPKTNRSAEAMKVLTSQQALQDLAQLLTWFKTQNKEMKDAKVVTFGGSYPGFLSAWFRAKYPNLVNVAVVSSAPLNYTYEFPEYVNTISKILQQEKPDCFNRIKSAFTCMQSILNGAACSQSNVTSKNIGKELNYCDRLKTDADYENLYTKIGRKIWAHNKPGTLSLLPANGLTHSLCDILLKQNDTDIVKAYGQFISESNNSNCNRRRKRGAPDPESDIGGYSYSFTWQTLNEFVNFQVADPVLGMLGINWGKYELKYHSSFYPNAGFDEKKLNENLARTKELYPFDFWKNNATCTIFTYGSWDPWARKGITSSSQISDKNTVYLIPKMEHTDDEHPTPTNPFANSSLLENQKQIVKQIGTYLNNPDC